MAASDPAPRDRGDGDRGSTDRKASSPGLRRAAAAAGERQAQRRSPRPRGGGEATALAGDSLPQYPNAMARFDLLSELRFGFHDGVPRTLGEIRQELAPTRERIRQIEQLALCRLRHLAFGLRTKARVQ
jgi:hypothetical protein